MGNHAMVFGASGIQGWAVINQLVSDYPTPESFDRITAMTNRPVTDEVLWPRSGKLQIISGINLLNEGGQEGLQKELEAQVPDISTVSHIFFFAYVFKEDPAQEIDVNVTLLQRAVTAIENLSPKLEFVLLPTGTKAYGVHCLKAFPFPDKLPLKEDLPRIPEPWQSQNFYYNQTDWLEAQSKDKPWTWCEIRPDVVVGFVPNNNVYCLAQNLATYLSCYRELEGEGAECPIPGTDASWKVLSNDSGQDTVAKFAIHAALHPEICGSGAAFNVASQAKPVSWEQRWPSICEYFGLKGLAPPEGGSGPQPGEYLTSHFNEWKEIEKKYGLVTGRVGNDRSLGTYQYFIMTLFDFDRQLDLGKMHKAWSEGGKVEEAGSEAVWWAAFERFRAAKIIP